MSPLRSSAICGGAKRCHLNLFRKRRFRPLPRERMKGARLILLGLGLGVFSPVFAQDAAYNPDPGASKKPIQAPFYQVPPGTPPDYGLERDPLLDLPHAPLLDIHRVKKVFQN